VEFRARGHPFGGKNELKLLKSGTQNSRLKTPSSDVETLVIAEKALTPLEDEL
jgi:hypothetical protein